MTAALLLRLLLTMACVMAPAAAVAQDPHAGHGQKPAEKAVTKPQPKQPPQDPHAGHGQKPAEKDATKPEPAKQPPQTKNPATNKSAPVRPAATKPQAPEKQPPAEDHSAHMAQGTEAPKEPIPPLTDADRAAAFPPALGGHPAHDKQITTFVLLDQLEWQGKGDGGANWDSRGWIGGDLNRMWFRSEGESENQRVENALVEVLWGRSLHRWWDVVAGVRRDFRPGAGQTWVGAGIQGLAPYWFEVEATGYVGEGGRTQARFEVEYELLLTNRLILQPLIEGEIYGKNDELRGVGAGLSTLESGLRLRYEFRREFAPYIGLTWHRKLFGTADFARADGEDVAGTRVAFGLRTWF
jgi:copper resistance protein B